MTVRIALLAAGLGVLGASAGCKHDHTGGGPGGGGGGWLVGSSGLMAQVGDDGKLGAGYELGSTDTLHAIACRYAGEAWVAGDHGTLLYTNDGGASWLAQTVPTAENLRAVATQDHGPVFIAGDHTFLTSTDTGAHWTQVATDAQLRSVAAAQEGKTVLALAEDGRVLAFDGGALVQRTTIAGGKAIAISPDGNTAVVAGNGLSISTDAGVTWTSLGAEGTALEDVNILDDNTITAVGAAGAIVHVSFGSVSVQHVGAADLHTVHLSGWADDDAVIGYAAGEGGEVLVTHDGGWTWENGPNVGRTVFGADQIGLGHR